MSFLRRFVPLVSRIGAVRGYASTSGAGAINGPLNENAGTVGEVLQRYSKTSFYSKGGLSLTCLQNDLVCDAVRKMVDTNVGALLVMKDVYPSSSQAPAGNLAGIVTERDYMRELITEGRTAQDTRVKEIMTPAKDMIMCSPATPAVEAMASMTSRRCRHLPVVDEGVLVGMLSIQDCVGSVVESIERIDEIQPFVGRGAAKPAEIRDLSSLDESQYRYKSGAERALGEERFQDVESLTKAMEKAERRGKAARLLKELEEAYAMPKGEGEALTESLRAELMALTSK